MLKADDVNFKLVPCAYCAGSGRTSNPAGGGTKVNCIRCGGHGKVVLRLVFKKIIQLVHEVSYHAIEERDLS